MKRFISIAAIILSAVSFGAQAQSTKELTVLVAAAPGGGLESMSRGIKSTFEANGYTVNLEQAKTCKGAEAWLKNNPSKPVVMAYMVEEEIYRQKAPTADDACDLNFSQKSLITLAMTSTFNICSMKPKEQSEQTLKEFLKGGHKIGVTYYASTNAMVASGLTKSLNIDSKIVRLQGNPKLMQAVISGDVDYVMNTVSAPVVQAGGHCFFTTASDEVANKLNTTSINKVNAKSPWAGAGQMYTIIGFNVDKTLVKPLAVQAVEKSPEFNKLTIGNSVISTGLSDAKEWEAVKTHIARFKD